MSGRVDVLDLFCGCGGLSLGFARHNSERFRVIGGIDTDRHACTTYEAEIGAPAVVADVEGLLDSEHRSHLLQNFAPWVAARSLSWGASMPRFLRAPEEGHTVG